MFYFKFWQNESSADKLAPLGGTNVTLFHIIHNKLKNLCFRYWFINIVLLNNDYLQGGNIVLSFSFSSINPTNFSVCLRISKFSVSTLNYILPIFPFFSTDVLKYFFAWSKHSFVSHLEINLPCVCLTGKADTDTKERLFPQFLCKALFGPKGNAPIHL